MSPSGWPIRPVLIASSILLYVTAAFLPALTFRVFSDSPAQFSLENHRGYNLLLLGGLTLLVGFPAWLANPLWAAGIIALLRHRVIGARMLLGGAVLLALVSLTLFRHRLPHDEAGVTKMLLQRPLIGFYLWLSSIVLALIAAMTGPAPAGPPR